MSELQNIAALSDNNFKEADIGNFPFIATLLKFSLKTSPLLIFTERSNSSSSSQNQNPKNWLQLELQLIQLQWHTTVVMFLINFIYFSQKCFSMQ